jgi:small GTP-binding protein
MEIEVVKVVLLGEAGVGKTCIIKQFTENKFDKNELSSLSAQYVSKTIDYVDYNKTIKFDIWDTVGEERFRSIAKIFYKDAKVIIFVYDITSKKTFDALINFWYEEIRNNCVEKPIYAVVGNKNDLYMNQQVDIFDAKDFTKNLGGIFQLTSAKTADGISVLFDNIGKKILKPTYQYDAIDNIAKEKYIKKKEEEEKNKRNRIKLNNNSNINNKNGNNKKNNQTNQVDTNKNKKSGCC